MFADSDVVELQTRLAAAELEKNKLTDALLAEKKIKLELSEKTDDLNSQLSQQKQLLLECRKRCTCSSCHFFQPRISHCFCDSFSLKCHVIFCEATTLLSFSQPLLNSKSHILQILSFYRVLYREGKHPAV